MILLGGTVSNCLSFVQPRPSPCRDSEGHFSYAGGLLVLTAEGLIVGRRRRVNDPVLARNAPQFDADSLLLPLID